ncbi:MAG: hypothetical protein AMJ91_02485 [candidate division Zixibacteria bacterium SM23_73_3]|nr:MAG: hypothetical protein AMJ91_02485 [candidate division Zixibacteria bacterium SM23_73_3]
MIVPKAKKLFAIGIKIRLVLKKVILAWLVVFATTFIPLAGFAQNKNATPENPSSNEEFLRESIRSVLGRTFDDFPPANSKLLLLKAEGEHPANWLLEDELVFYLLSSNYQVALHPTAPNDDLSESQSLFYRIMEMSLNYPQIKRKGFLGARLVTRKTWLNLSFRLKDNVTGKVLWTKRGKEERSDWVKKSMIKSVNNPSYPFLSPSLPDDPHSRFLEPALVVAVVGGLIYLFFANR